MRRALSSWIACGAFALFAVWLALAAGSAGFTPLAWDGPLAGVRLPRAMLAFGVGAVLAVSGAVLQVLLRNPLADPYVLGVASGAGLGGLAAVSMFGIGWWMQAGAAAGALGAIALVFALGYRSFASQGASASPETAPVRLLLTGVMVSSACSAAESLMLATASDTTLRGMLFWLIGDLSGADVAQCMQVGAALVVLVAVAVPAAPRLNLMLHGELFARSLGVDTARLRRVLVGVTALATAAVVTAAGSIGFVGLVVPHVLRLVFGNDQRVLLPAAVLAGGGFLTLADALARVALSPQQLPVGVITALIGAPVFLVLLSRGGRR